MPCSSPTRCRRGAPRRAPAGSSAPGAEALVAVRRFEREVMRRRLDRRDVLVVLRETPSPARSRCAARGCACRSRARAATSRCVQRERGDLVAPDRMRARIAVDAQVACARRSRYSSSEWNEARRRIAARMSRTPSSSSTSSEPVDEPMNTLMPAQPGRRSSRGKLVGVLARAADEEGEIAMHAVVRARDLVGERLRAGGGRGSVLGISNTAVTPPMTAPREPVSRSSLWVEPGLAEMHLGVDHAGQDMQAAAVDHLAGRGRATGRRSRRCARR